MPGFLDGLRTRSTSTEVLHKLATSAANQYLEGKTPLNDSIKKLASQYSLNPHQVARVCEMANLETHRALWKTATEKEKVAFDVADPAKIVVIRIGSGGTPDAGGSPSGEFAGPPTSSPATGPSMAQLFGVDPANVHNGLTDVPEKSQLVVILQKTAAEKEEVSDDLIMLAARNESEEKRLYWLVKQAFLGEGLSLETMYAAAWQNGFGPIAKDLFPKFASDLHKETARASLVKIAWKAPEELIDQNLPATIVNGRHPIMISLDTLLRYRDQEQRFNWHLSRINDRNTITNQRIRELT